TAAHQAGVAATAAAQAGTDAAASAQAAKQAGDYAASAGADAATVRAAAARAQSNADRATRAAQAAVSFANIAANAAFTARDAANRAVADANAAAAAADDAADHAGQAADAAALATAHANAAVQAAQAAVDAATAARVVYDAARAADTQRIRIAFEQGDEAALAASTEVARLQNQAGWDAAQQAKRSAEVNRLIAEATDPATPQPAAVNDARKVALALAGAEGSWTRAAAMDALGSSDAMLLEFVHSGIADAAGQDDRATLSALMGTGSDAMRTAAQAAMDGSDADVATFLQTRDYPGRLAEDRLAVNQIQAAARAAGDTVTVQQAQRALDAGTGQALRQFLEIGQYGAAAADQRVKVNQILADPDSGPELAAAAQIALDGPPAFLTQFLAVGRFAAAQRDQDSASHDAVVSALLAQAAEAAAVAVQNAMEAQAAAATARNAAGDAARYAQQAADSAAEAAGYAQQAQQSAAQARDSAARAAASANTAVAAAAAANNAARRAARSAVWAQASAEHAATSATQAYAAARNAYNAAVAAGKDARAAVAAATEAFNAARRQSAAEVARWAYLEAQKCQAPGVDTQTCMDNINKIIKNPAKVAYINAGVCETLYQQGSPAYQACLGDVLNPNFEQNQTLLVLEAIVTLATAVFTALATIDLGVIVAFGIAACAGVCAAILEIASPFLTPELVGLPVEGFGLLAGTTVSLRTAAVLERSAVEGKAQDAALARLISAIKLCGRNNSFAAGTPVLLADGSSRPIQDLRTGDRVLSTDPVTGATDAEPVTGTITGTGVKHLVDVTVDTDGQAGSATATLTATDNHPFWVADTGDWVTAGNLRAGQWLRTGSGTWVQITGTDRRTETTTVHNLTVATYHTFYVAAGTASALVHNDCGNYHWAPIPAPKDVLPRELWWDPSQGIPVIGRWPGVTLPGRWPGHTFFNLPLKDWTPEKNDAWIQSIKDQRGTVYVGSPTQGNYWNKDKKEPSTFAREIQQLLDDGYRWVGDYLVPPPL
ncbi:MAG: hypothetical protein V7603_2151, partial [Micromonosporaceae bacterium]